MTVPPDDFYANLPLFRNFTEVMDPNLFSPLPGDWVVGDGDGVVVVPGTALEQVAAAGRLRAEKEIGYFAALRGGATTLELLGLDAGLVDGA